MGQLEGAFRPSLPGPFSSFLLPGILSGPKAPRGSLPAARPPGQLFANSAPLQAPRSKLGGWEAFPPAGAALQAPGTSAGWSRGSPPLRPWATRSHPSAGRRRLQKPRRRDARGHGTLAALLTGPLGPAASSRQEPEGLAVERHGSAWGSRTAEGAGRRAQTLAAPGGSRGWAFQGPRPPSPPPEPHREKRRFLKALRSPGRRQAPPGPPQHRRSPLLPPRGAEPAGAGGLQRLPSAQLLQGLPPWKTPPPPPEAVAV